MPVCRGRHWKSNEEEEGKVGRPGETFSREKCQRPPDVLISVTDKENAIVFQSLPVKVKLTMSQRLR